MVHACHRSYQIPLLILTHTDGAFLVAMLGSMVRLWQLLDYVGLEGFLGVLQVGRVEHVLQLLR